MAMMGGNVGCNTPDVGRVVFDAGAIQQQALVSDLTLSRLELRVYEDGLEPAQVVSLDTNADTFELELKAGSTPRIEVEAYSLLQGEEVSVYWGQASPDVSGLSTTELIVDVYPAGVVRGVLTSVGTAATDIRPLFRFLREQALGDSPAERYVEALDGAFRLALPVGEYALSLAGPPLPDDLKLVDPPTLTVTHGAFSDIGVMLAPSDYCDPSAATPVDADGDGARCTVDCDDGDASLNLSDLDQDGASSCAGDCDDLDPFLNLIDADGDGLTPCAGDCNDAHPGCTDNCNVDSDADGRADCEQTCTGTDSDGDGVCDPDDVCAGGNDFLDSDSDGVPDACDVCPTDNPNDSDNDTICDGSDACPGFDDRLDGDSDGVPDACDTCPIDNPDDSDGDGVCNSADICPGFIDAVDIDSDGVPDGCDPCPNDPNDDSDNDGVCDSNDICFGFDDAIDGDGDGSPDGCDPCPLSNPDDVDGDLVCDNVDLCPGFDDTLDGDSDGVPDGCDPCPLSSPDDSDSDGICDDVDTCIGCSDAVVDLSLNTSIPTGWRDIEVDPFNGLILYGLSVTGMIHRSDDAGGSWAPLCRLPNIGNGARMRVAQSTDRTVYASNHTAVYRVDALGGGACSSITSGLGTVYGYNTVHCFAEAASTGDVYAWARTGDFGQLYRSQDAGATWSEEFHDIYSDAYMGWITIDPTDPGHRIIVRTFAGFGEGTYYTSDGSNYTLANAFNSTNARVLFDPRNPSWAYTNRGYFTNDGGQNWTAASPYNMAADWEIDASGAGYQLVDIGGGQVDLRRAADMMTPTFASLRSFSGTVSGGRVAVGGTSLAVVANQQLWVSTDAGGTFNVVTSSETGTGTVQTLHSVDGTTLYGVTDGWAVVKSSDGGVSWSAVYFPTDIVTPTVEPRLRVSAADPSAVFVIGDRPSGSTYDQAWVWSADGMASGNSAATAPSTWGGIVIPSATQAGTVYVLGSPSKFSADYGQTWQNLSPNPWPLVWRPAGGAIHPTDANVVWVVDDGKLWEGYRTTGTRVDITSRVATALGEAVAGLELFYRSPDWVIRVISKSGALAESVDFATSFAAVAPLGALDGCDRRHLMSLAGDPDTLATACWASATGVGWSHDGGASWFQAKDRPDWTSTNCSVNDVVLTPKSLILACLNRVPVVLGRLPTTCGDALPELPEQCDNATSNSDVTPDACRTDCSLPRCGDGVIDTGETCDDGNLVDDDGCDHDCTPSGCGNGILNTGEACDHGAANSDTLPSACRTNCTWPVCGDGVMDKARGEECDDGASNSTAPNACRPDCTLAPCGDGIVDTAFGEECDDGNAIVDDGCDPNCRVSGCGNGILNAGEECDNGPANSDTIPDHCRLDCTLPRCGDGVIDPLLNEQCDQGAANANAPDACRPDCSLPVCQDGIVDSGAGEECDDGNNDGQDGCTEFCTTCGNGIVTAPEECDDATSNSETVPDACRTDCRLPFCGDGVVDSVSGEVCDPGFTPGAPTCRVCAGDCSRSVSPPVCEIPVPPQTRLSNPCEYGLVCDSVTEDAATWTCTNARFTRTGSWTNADKKLISHLQSWGSDALQYMATHFGFVSCAAIDTGAGYTFDGLHRIGQGVWSSQPQGILGYPGYSPPSGALSCNWVNSSPITLYDGQTGRWGFTSEPAECSDPDNDNPDPLYYVDECNGTGGDLLFNVVCTK